QAAQRDAARINRPFAALELGQLGMNEADGCLALLLGGLPLLFRWHFPRGQHLMYFLPEFAVFDQASVGGVAREIDFGLLLLSAVAAVAILAQEGLQCRLE